MKLIAASVEPREVAEQLRSELGLDFPIGSSLGERAVASASGAFYEAEGFGQGPFLHATGFILDEDGKVRITVYSNGALGRLQPDHCLSCIDAFTGVPVVEVPTEVSARPSPCTPCPTTARARTRCPRPAGADPTR